MKTVQVEGEKMDRRIFIYALSTCGWCKLTKQFMGDLGFAFEYINVDTASSEDRREIVSFFKERNIPLGFPVTIIDDEIVISGYKPDKFKEVLGH